MRQALPRAILEKLVHERARVGLDGIEETMALPYGASDGDLTAYDVEDAFLVDADSRVLLDDGGQRSSALEAHLEAQVLETKQDAVDCTLRDAHREHARETSPRRERLVGIEQRIHELADPFLGNFPQRPHGVLGDRVPREQRNHMASRK